MEVENSVGLWSCVLYLLINLFQFIEQNSVIENRQYFGQIYNCKMYHTVYSVPRQPLDCNFSE